MRQPIIIFLAKIALRGVAKRKTASVASMVSEIKFALGEDKKLETPTEETVSGRCWKWGGGLPR